MASRVVAAVVEVGWQGSASEEVELGDPIGLGAGSGGGSWG